MSNGFLSELAANFISVNMNKKSCPTWKLQCDSADCIKESLIKSFTVHLFVHVWCVHYYVCQTSSHSRLSSLHLNPVLEWVMPRNNLFIPHLHNFFNNLITLSVAIKVKCCYALETGKILITDFPLLLTMPNLWFFSSSSKQMLQMISQSGSLISNQATGVLLEMICA